MAAAEARRWMEENKASADSASLRLMRCDGEEMLLSVKGKKLHVSLAMSEGQLFMAYMDYEDDNARLEMDADLFDSKLERLSESLQKIQVQSSQDGLRKIRRVLSEIADRYGGGGKAKKKSLVLASMSERHQMQTVMKEFKVMAEGIENAMDTDFLGNITLDMPDETDISKWHVKMGMRMFQDKGFFTDFKARFPQEGGHVLLEITFTDKFPFDPPFVRVVRPRFQVHTGHVTVGGSICMELLTPAGWTPAFNLEAVLVQIHNAILEGGGRLDLADHSDYSYGEAIVAFDRAARVHNWILDKQPAKVIPKSYFRN